MQRKFSSDCTNINFNIKYLHLSYPKKMFCQTDDSNQTTSYFGSHTTIAYLRTILQKKKKKITTASHILSIVTTFITGYG